MDQDLGPKKGETAEQFKDRIADTQREMQRVAAASTPPAPVAPAPAPAPTPAQVGPNQPAVNPPAPAPAAAKSAVVTGNSEVDEWWAKKGFKSQEDMAQSYRELERELTRQAQERRAKDAAAAAQPAPPPTYPPYLQAPGYPPAPPAYVPPAPVAAPARPPANAEEIAKRYGLTAEDLERVGPLINDMSQSIVRAELNRVMPGVVNRVQVIDREVSKNAELVSLMADPTFKNPQVQFEMHRILQEDPRIIAQHPTPYRYAHEQALVKLARVNLGGPNPSPGAPSPDPLNRPPTTAGGNGGGGGGAPNGPTPDQMTPDIFARLPLKDKEAHLKAVGALGR